MGVCKTTGEKESVWAGEEEKKALWDISGKVKRGLGCLLYGVQYKLLCYPVKKIHSLNLQITFFKRDTRGEHQYTETKWSLEAALYIFQLSDSLQHGIWIHIYILRQ